MEFSDHTYFIETYGCQMNKAESAALARKLDSWGWRSIGKSDKADLVVLNTCSVRKTAENRIWGRIGYYKHLKRSRNFLLAVVGCMSERLKERLFKNAGEIDIVVGNFQKQNFMNAVSKAQDTGDQVLLAERAEFKFEQFHGSEDGIRAFVPVMHGCNNYCSYCIVPHIRGEERSRSPESIINELKRLDAGGIKDVTLLGQNINSYRYRNGRSEIDFPGLLLLLPDQVRNIKRIRFLTSHPKDMSKELIKVVAETPLFCRHIHLPVQHGSDRILKSMNRGYSRKRYLLLLDDIKSRINDVTITTDILIGFPGEEESDLDETIDLMRRAEFDYAFTYRYNAREGTSAFAMGDTVPEEIKLKRLSRVIELQKEISYNKRVKRLGSTVTVIVESLSKKNKGELLGRTESDEMVVFPGKPELIGHMAAIRLASLNGTTYIGKEITQCLGE